MFLSKNQKKSNYKSEPACIAHAMKTLQTVHRSTWRADVRRSCGTRVAREPAECALLNVATTLESWTNRASLGLKMAQVCSLCTTQAPKFSRCTF